MCTLNSKGAMSEINNVCDLMENLDIENYVERLKSHLSMSKINHEKIILEQKSLKEAHVYAVINKISSQKYGTFLEKYIRKRFNYQKNKAADCTGDATKNDENTEIKVSLGGTTHSKFNFVQIRPNHNCDFYLLTAYHLCDGNVEEMGELYIFKIPSEDIKKIVVSFGGYAHGTVKKHGPITSESILESSKEYAIRPTFNDNCWKALLPHRVFESDI